MKILLTGFAPFGGEETNPSYEAVKLVPAREGLYTAQLPVGFDAAPKALDALIAQYAPDAVLLTGQAGGRAAVTVEKIAVNWGKGETAFDESLQGGLLEADGNTAYWSTLPVESIAAAMNRVGVPASVSFTAGQYVCNATLYHCLRHHPVIRACFIHVPYAPHQVAGKPRQESLPTMAIQIDALALDAAIRAILQG